MEPIKSAKRAARRVFGIGVIMGALPVLAHLLVAWLVAGSGATVQGATQGTVDISNQNWFVHLIFVAFSVGGGAMINYMTTKHPDRDRLLIPISMLVASLFLLYTLFEGMAVFGSPGISSFGISVIIIIVVAMCSAYITHMEIAVLNASQEATSGT